MQDPVQSVSVSIDNNKANSINSNNTNSTSSSTKLCPERWKTFYKSMDKVLHLFQSNPIQIEPPVEESSFNEKLQQAKYLTAPRLLRLQVFELMCSSV